MDGGVIIAIIGAIAAVTSAAFVLVKGLGENKNTRAASEAAGKAASAAAAKAQFEANIELNKYIDGRVEAALEEPLKQIAELQDRVELLTTRERTTKDILRRWVQRLFFWDERGRKGDMPMPSVADMATLDLSDIESDTKTRAEVSALLEQPNN